MRPEAILEPGGRRSLRNDPGGEAVRVHRLHLGVPDQVDALGGELGDVFLPGARIRTEVLGGSELRRIDEDRDHDPLGAALGEPHQRHMAVMERTHGRDQRDSRLLGAQASTARRRQGRYGRRWDFSASGLDSWGNRGGMFGVRQAAEFTKSEPLSANRRTCITRSRTRMDRSFDSSLRTPAIDFRSQ